MKPLHRRATFPSIAISATPYAIGGLLFFLSATLFEAHAADAEDPTPQKITYDDHVRPIFRQHCLSCHSADAKKGDLAIDAWATAMEGGASGEVIVPGDLESSRLWDLVSHQDEPPMPPDSEKLPDDQLALIGRWIEGGALENRGSVANVNSKPSLAMLQPIGRGKPEGPAAMPESVFREPVIYSTRAGAVTALAASPWAPVIAVAGQRQVSFYHSETANLLGVIPFLEGLPQALAFSHDGSRLLVAGGQGGAIGLAAVYDVTTGSRLSVVGDEYDAVHAADINAKQTRIALGGPLKVVRVFHAADNSLAFEIRKHTDWITTMAFSPDGELLLTADRAGGAWLWEAETGREVASLRGHAGAVTSASWRADSQIAATTGSDGSIRLWDRKEGKQVKTWPAHGGGATSVSFAVDGRMVSAGRDRAVKLWKGDGGHVKDLASLSDIALATCVTHDGKRVAAGDFSGDVHLIDMETGKQVGRLAPNPPTLAMRVATAAVAMEAATDAIPAAAAAKKEADKAMVVVQTEAKRRTAAVGEEQRKMRATQAAREAQAQEVDRLQQAAVASARRLTEPAAALMQASAAVTAAEAHLSQTTATGGGTVAAEAKLTAATNRVRKAIAAIEAAQMALKEATKERQMAETLLATTDTKVTAAQDTVLAAQSAVDQFAQRIAAAESDVVVKTEALASRQAKAAAARQVHEAARREYQEFASAIEHFDATIGQADKRVAAQAQALADAVVVKKTASADLQARRTVAEQAAKKLAAAKAECDRLRAATDQAQALADKKAQAAAESERAHFRAEAAAAQIRADRELFKKAQSVRADYAK